MTVAGTPIPDGERDRRWMAEALALARRAAAAGEVPVGAVLVRGDEVIGEGWNRPIGACDPTAHAEVVALRAAAVRTGNYRLIDSTLYVTLEPCPMCAAAISFARIRRLYYGASDPKSGGVAQGPRIFAQPQCHHTPDVYDGIAETASAELLRKFFAERR